MKEIEVTEESITHGGHVYVQGKHTVSDELAAYFCSNGWANTPDGSIKSGERSLEPKAVDPAVLKQELK